MKKTSRRTSELTEAAWGVCSAVAGALVLLLGFLAVVESPLPRRYAAPDAGEPFRLSAVHEFGDPWAFSLYLAAAVGCFGLVLLFANFSKNPRELVRVSLLQWIPPVVLVLFLGWMVFTLTVGEIYLAAPALQEWAAERYGAELTRPQAMDLLAGRGLLQIDEGLKNELVLTEAGDGSGLVLMESEDGRLFQELKKQ